MDKYKENQIFILVDTNTYRLCLPDFLDELRKKYNWIIPKSNILTISSGEEHKTIETIQLLWHFLSNSKATRKSLLINLGGGVITDLGGFVASTYRRGIDYINVPTTLLSMVDAGYGGKTGFDFEGLKNAIGTFYTPKDVWIMPKFLKTLPCEEILSGYAEVIKHALLSHKTAFEDALDKIELFLHIDTANDDEMTICERLIWDSIYVKQQVINMDPTEQNIRKCLNFGHTVGHALEELSFIKGKPMRHGYAVMYGLLAELYLSSEVKGLSISVVNKITDCIKSYYGTILYDNDDFETVYEFMRHDKKNASVDEVNFTLLSEIGRFEIDNIIPKDLVERSMIFIDSI